MKELNRDDFNHVESILLELFRMRRGKIVKLADSIKLNSDIYNQLTVEENICLLYTSPSPRDLSTSRMPSSA